MSELLSAQLQRVLGAELVRPRHPCVDVPGRLGPGAGGVPEGQEAPRRHRQQRLRVVRGDGRAGDLHARRRLPRLHCADNKRQLNGIR